MKLEPEDRVIERFEEILDNRDKKLVNSIRVDTNMKNIYSIFMERGLNSIKLANAVFKICRTFPSALEDKKRDFTDELDLAEFFKRIVVGDPAINFYDWVIEISYYSMYDLATAAIAKEGFKCTTHYTTRLALEYMFCIKGKDRKKLFEIYDRVLLKREEVQKLQHAAEKREIARYSGTETVGQNEAEEILKDAKEFVKEVRKLLI